VLTELSFRGVGLDSRAGVGSLAQLRSLQTLGASSIRITAVMAAELSPLVSLRDLILSGNDPLG
jgi:hypothetical protein